MVAPPLPISGGTKQLDTKDATRNRMRQIRRAEFESHDEGTAALRFLRPPEVLVKKLPKDASIGFYRSRTTEAPTIRYAEFFHEREHKLALPWAAHARDGITFREWKDPFDEDELEKDPFGGVQPTSDAAEMIPDVIFVPGLGFTANCDRIGRGGGHYDRWLAKNRDTIAIGMAWDAQVVESLPLDEHDQHLDFVVTPTKIYERG
ncbi:MAG: 5-formyltetrahydrofolate cyclo-ligase [Sphingomonadales bacterium CG12_big_fil_rev_8_21_14_0_65_65_10]|nr:MAG: 5-formyltetrahydrofolate cyclo-ligase [Sphingomonadales bacterium CG12_big_fil_rev_8_21_14_0_65_65_10]